MHLTSHAITLIKWAPLLLKLCMYVGLRDRTNAMSKMRVKLFVRKRNTSFAQEMVPEDEKGKRQQSKSIYL